MRNGWGDIYRAYEGACDNYQHLYVNGESVGYVNGFDYDGDWGYNAYKVVNAYDLKWELLGRFDSREEAQRALSDRAN